MAENKLLKEAAGFIPGVGTVMDVVDVGTSVAKGDYLNAAIDTAAGVAGIVPGVGRFAGKGIKQLKNFFNPKALEKAKNQNETSRDILVEMPIDDFLAVAKKVEPTEVDGSVEKLKNVRKVRDKNIPFETIPTLNFQNMANGTGKVTGHNGRHRALALKEIGETTIPVVLKSDAGGKGPSIRWGKQNDPNNTFDFVPILPKKLLDEGGEGVSVDMPNAAKNIRKEKNIDTSNNFSKEKKSLDQETIDMLTSGKFPDPKTLQRLAMKNNVLAGKGTNRMPLDVWSELQRRYKEEKDNTQGFAQGGLADMNTQTQRAFAIGGEAETVDPVSGNDVPPGSLPEEVRDDIDAKLSEGEYVVPADVVRYYGVKFFENLRTKAKQGLQQMDEDGRIGGEPTSEMFLPFDVSELEVEDENGVRMAVGGLVPGYYVGGGVGSSFGGGYGYEDPFKTPTVVKPPEPVAPVTPGVPSTGSYVRTYYDRYGNPVSIMFINGQPQQSLEGLTTSNPDRTDTVQENQRFEGAKLNDLGQPIDKDGNIITASSSGGFNLPSFGFGTSAAEEFDYAKTLADETDLDRYKKIGAYASGELAKNKPSLLGRIGQTLIGVGVGAIAGPAAGLIAGQAYGINKNQQNIADAQLSLKVLESQYTGKNINATGATVGYKPDPPQSKNAAIKSAYDALKEELENIADQNPSFFKQAMGLAAPDIDARFKKLGLNQKVTAADAIVAEARKGVKSAAELAQDARLARAKNEWAGQPKKNVSWNQTGPTEATYEKYVNIGRQSEKITARGQVMRTQADAFNQNRADDQAAGAKRAGQRAKARREGYKGKTGQDAVDQFNRDNADDIRTKYGGNKQTDSNGQDSGCFLTTAIVEHRGESDDGPTLTKLRHFRDTYLVDYPEEIKKYYNIAPKIVAAIPKNNPEWDWVGTQIDSAIQDIDNNMPDKAHKTYKNMVLKLETNWLN